ncbi:ATP-binding protein, partial [Arachidicoccus sp.]|uniref:hybrid sensor histidine kinase/response regulator transcription factor n=1 Tax=Arachidicoccus sp. TaxID=1872624 RepID=UPI003D1DD176
NDAITYTSKITLSYSQAYFTLKFAALNYVNSESNEYAYKMEGLDDDQWHNVGTERSATYTNLAPGNYTFKVKAANNDGLWNDKITTLQIKILPPIWRTWYAYLFYILVILAILYTIYYYSLKENRLKNDLKLQRAINENEKEFTQQKINFFTNISHEIKTPLTLILAPLDKLIAKIQDVQYPELGLMQRNGKKLIKLLDQLLSFRRFEAGAMMLQAQESDMVAFTQSIVSDFENLAAKRDIQLQFSAAQERILVWFDADKYEKIVSNLLSNALKFTPKGGRVDVSLDIFGNDNAHLFAELKVKDNGTGITKDHLNKVFENFYHNDETNMHIEGTGIGLSYTKALVELHHGKIDVDSHKSTEGCKGYTCFSVQIPLGDAHLRENEKLKEKTSSTLSAVANYKYQHQTHDDDVVLFTDSKNSHEINEGDVDQPILLILEDNIELQSFIATNFQSIYKIHTASNGKEGWAKAIEILPDIIISDIMMPEMSGMEFCQLAKNDARTSHIPLILLTALDTDSYKIEGFQTGADEYITKPFALPILEARIENLLASRKKLQEYFQKDIKLEPNIISISKRDEEFLEKVMAYIEENLMEPELNVEDLSKEVNMSRVTLYRKIKALTNLSALEFIRSIRLKKAGQLLQANEHSVNEVCYMVGFSDVDYFRKCFKNQFETTPKKYAARFIKNADK